MSLDVLESTNNQIKKLEAQLLIHGKLIVAFDWDDTLFNTSNTTSIPEIKVARSLLELCNELGHIVILHTCRGEDHIKSLLNTLDFNLEYDHFNTSPVDNSDVGNGTKPYANIYLDDKAGLWQSIYVLRHVLEKQLRNEI